MPSVKADVLRWARESAGFDIEDAASAVGLKVDRLRALEAGEVSPTRPMLQRMAKQYRRSLLAFYLGAPPRKGDRGEDFRTLPADRPPASDAVVDALLRDLRVRQSLVREVLEEDDEVRSVAFVGSARMDRGVEALVSALQETLGIDRVAYRREKTSELAFGYLRRTVEKAGVFVLLAGDLGSYHTAIPVETFRGFAVADSIAPFVVINDHDAKVAWSFTLLHELAHLWLGKTGVSGSSADRDIERFCNDVASELLVPAQELAALDLPAALAVDEAVQVLAAFARPRHVSRQMVAYKLYRAGRIERDRWNALDIRIREIWAQEQLRRKAKEREDDTGPNYYVVRRHRIGDALLDLTRRAVDDGALSPVRAAKVLGVKARSVLPLLAG